MRQLLSAIIITSLFPLSAVAQTEKEKSICHEIAIGTGDISVWAIIFSNSMRTWGGDHVAKHPFPRPIAVHYAYCYNEKLGIGATVSYEHVDKKEFYYSLMPQVKWNWYNHKYFSLYSRVGLGVTYVYYMNRDMYDADSQHRFFPAFHLSPIGIEAGWEHFRAFFDAGAGAQCFIQIGVKCRF